MRLRFIVPVLLFIASVATASPNVSFQVVIKGGDTVLTDGGQPSGDSYGNTGQVVVGQGGSVGILATTQTNGTDVVLFQAAGSNIVQTIATGGDIIGPSGPLDTFDNLAINPNAAPTPDTRVTFAAEDSTTSSLGVFQQDVGVTSTQTVAYGNTGSVRLVTSGQPDGGLVPIQVNSTGQVVFSGTDNTGAPSIFLGNLGNTPTTLYTQSGGTTVTQLGNRLGVYPAVTAQPTVGTSVLTTSSINNVSTVVGGVASSIGSTFHPPASGPTILGVANYGLGNAALFYSQTPTTATIVLHDSGGDYSLDTYGASATGPTAVDAEMTPQGQIAFYIPTTHAPTNNGGKLDFYNAATTHTGVVQTIAQGNDTTVVSDPTGPAGANYVIDQLQTGASLAPMVNKNSIVVFDANIEDTNPSDPDPFDPHQALLEWQPGLPGNEPLVLMQVGDFIPGLSDISDSSTAVAGIFFNGLDTESDTFKDGLSDDNYLAVGVQLFNGQNAVLLTQLTVVPEPSTAAAFLPLACAVLMARRRRAKLT